ncbi:hypothetical protein KGO5_01828 [Sinorhizobium sp. KGO-5]|nr:hypothetical protein KGO5_01828 [Sinorhizobium sp. KGO-5]
MEDMRETAPAMMQGMMAKDPDVAFVCGMIAHHTAAITKTVEAVRQVWPKCFPLAAHFGVLEFDGRHNPTF